MVDTVTFKVLKHLNPQFYDFALENSNNSSMGFILNSATGIVERSKTMIFKEVTKEYGDFQILNGNLVSPSYNYHASYQIKEDYVKIEMSLPKFIFGSNVFQLIDTSNFTRSPFELFKKSLQFVLESFLVPIFLNQIIISRIDFCYNQFLNKAEHPEKLLKHFKLKSNSYHQQKDYKSGLVSITKNSYFKIYLKHPEFLKHDHSKLLKSEYPFLNSVSALSKFIIRYEQQKKPSNWSYTFLTKFSNQKHLFPLFLKDKKQSKLEKFFKRRIQFSITPTLPYVHKVKKNGVLIKTVNKDFIEDVSNVYYMTEKYFNYMYVEFMSFISKKYNLNNHSTSHLKKTIVNNDKNKTMNVRILSLIKTFGSLENAFNNGALSTSTLRRYKIHLDNKNLSTTHTKINFNQSFSHYNYVKLMSSINLTHEKLNSDFISFIK